MSVVVDASLLVVLVTGDERGRLVDAKLRAWEQAEETLHAPALMPYEAANAIVRAAVAANLSAGDVIGPRVSSTSRALRGASSACRCGWRVGYSRS